MIRSLHALLAVLLLAGGWAMVAPVVAHEARPAYLEMRQADAEHYDVLWKVPGLGENKRLALHVVFDDETASVSPPVVTFANNAFVKRWRIHRPGGLDGSEVRIDGLQGTLTDVLVRLERADGTTQTLRVQPDRPAFLIAAVPSQWDVARSYFGLGVEHIALGIDHLLFVLALVILVRDMRKLFWTITAFTLAHSLTLAAATLGWLHVPPPPVEASIALSIMFLASEIVHARHGRPGLTHRWPWIVAFLFGLLHGLGFAGALSDVGLPGNAIPVALLFFNGGVEVGQLAFIAVVLAVMAAARRIRMPSHPEAWRVPVYSIGTVAAFWTIERIAAF